MQFFACILLWQLEIFESMKIWPLRSLKVSGGHNLQIEVTHLKQDPDVQFFLMNTHVTGKTLWSLWVWLQRTLEVTRSQIMSHHINNIHRSNICSYYTLIYSYYPRKHNSIYKFWNQKSWKCQALQHQQIVFSFKK